MLEEIDHISIAVRDLDAAVAFYRDQLGCELAHQERNEADGVDEALMKIADSFVQLISPTRDTSPVAEFLMKHGEGLHHVGYRVRDCELALESLKLFGHIPIDEHARKGTRGAMVAFVEPTSTFGTLIELVQAPRES